MAAPSPSETEVNKPREEDTTTREPALHEYKDLISSLPPEVLVIPVRLYQGVWWPEHSLLGVIAAQRHFKPRTTDIFLATFPKSGTTWTKALAFAAMTRSQYPLSHHPLLRLHPSKCVGALENMFNEGRSSEIDSLPSPRIIATHLPYSMLPDSIASSDCRIVYVCRDPKDVVVSAWHFGKKSLGDRFQLEQSSFEEINMAYCEGKNAVHGTVWDHILGYWKEKMRKPERVLFLQYEEMMAEPAANLKRLADFVGCPFSPEEEKEGVVEEIVRLCSFKNLSSLAKQNDPYFRKGEVGDWRNHMSPDLARRMDEVTKQKLQEAGLTLVSTQV